MTGKVLIADSVAGNRIQLAAMLRSAFHEVVQAASGAEALDLAAAEAPDIALLATRLPDMEGAVLRQRLRQRTGLRALPTILFGDDITPEARLAGLAAGADNVLGRPLHPALLSAQLRSLLRARDAEEELMLRDDTTRALGLAEPAPAFARRATVGLLSALGAPDPALCAALAAAAVPARLLPMAPDDALRSGPGHTPCDVFVLLAPAPKAEPALSLLTELRARRRTRLCPVVVVLDAPDPLLAARALDLGAAEVLCHGPCPDELALRLARAVARKHTADALRTQLRDGLQASVLDPLTGLFNRRYALPYLDRVARRARKSGRDFALMIVDIDHFKRINDRHGHGVGDRVLTAVAHRLRDDLRAKDMVARIGGEEFLVVTPDTSSEDAHATACRMCSAIGATPVPIGPDRGVSVTISVGVAMASALDGSAADQGPALMERADAALYAAKAEGRNKALLSRPAA